MPDYALQPDVLSSVFAAPGSEGQAAARTAGSCWSRMVVGGGSMTSCCAQVDHAHKYANNWIFAYIITYQTSWIDVISLAPAKDTDGMGMFFFWCGYVAGQC